ncbi:hypothetical protein BDP27DRAFT_1322495 [Rhodocollybia butyracea]|uniref:Uncharacterized protein n=1 Tax=Rhodocollybia butyracea TaxID=206335 RepID=A0A9P5PY26_9AGAR|nr:hypothetical protein BDP27DRAFT_1322495 [Rhodocollybia butyracea]
MKSIIASISIFLVAASHVVSSSPIRIARASLTKDSELVAFSPTIIYPKGHDIVWEAGTTTYNMTWETDNIPEELKNSTGSVLLGWLDNQEGKYNEHLDSDYPLSSGFMLADGFTSFTIDSSRNLPTRDSYVLCLMGDSGNISDPLTIVATQDQEQDNSNDDDGDNGDNNDNDDSDSNSVL